MKQPKKCDSMDHKNKYICPFHEDFEKRVERLGDTAEKEDDGIWDKIEAHDKRLQCLESNYGIILSNQDYFKKIMQGVLVTFIIYIGLWLVKTLGLGI